MYASRYRQRRYQQCLPKTRGFCLNIKPFLVADVNTWAAAGALVAVKLDVAGISYKKYIFNEKELIPDEKTLGSLMMAFSRDCDVIVAVGTGTLNDLCKFSSFWLDFVFATALSMDGFVSIELPYHKLCKTHYQASAFLWQSLEIRIFSPPHRWK